MLFLTFEILSEISDRFALFLRLVYPLSLRRSFDENHPHACLFETSRGLRSVLALRADCSRIPGRRRDVVVQQSPRETAAGEISFPADGCLARARAEILRAIRQWRLRILCFAGWLGHDQPSRGRRLPGENEHEGQELYRDR